MSGDADALGVSVILPAYNEELLLRSTVQSMIDSLRGLGAKGELVIVNDGSRDATPRIADELAAEFPEVRAVHQENTGIGGALRTGIGHAEGAYVLLWPADMPCDQDDLRPFLDASGEPDVVVGVRKRRVGYNPLMRFNSWIYPFIVRVLFKLRLRDVNWISMYRTSFAKRIAITQNGIPMLTEILVRIRDLGGRFREIDVEMKAREGGVASASRLKVMWRTLAGLFAFWRSWRREFASRSQPS